MKLLPRITTSLLVVAIAVGATLAPSQAEKKKTAVIGKAAPEFKLTDTEGETHKLSQYKGKWVVLEWINPDCPFVRKHYDSGNMQALQKKYGEKDVVWLTICSSAPGKQGYYAVADLKPMMKKKKSAAKAYLLDTDGTVGRSYAAKTTPHMYVINPDGVLIYAGAIDDKPSTKKADIEKATNYVQACLDAAMAGKEVAVTSSTPYGCSIKYAD